MAEEEELQEEVESLKDQLGNLESMLQNLMNMHKNVLEKVSTNSDLEDRYIRMLSLYKEFGRISPSLLSDIDDSISEEILIILFDSSSLNITEITERLRDKKGSASRHTVRDRLKKLKNKGLIKKIKKGKGKNYALTRETVNKWAEMLGIKK